MKRVTSVIAALLILRSVIRLVFANNLEKKESANAVPINDVMDGYEDSSRVFIDLSEYPEQISAEDDDGGAFYIVSDDDYYYIAYMYVSDADRIEPDDSGYYHLTGAPVEADYSLMDFVIEYMNEPYWNSDGEWVEFTGDDVFTEDDYYSVFGSHYLDATAALGNERSSAYVAFFIFGRLGAVVLAVNAIVAVIRLFTGRRRSQYDNVPDPYSSSTSSYSGADYEPILRDSNEDYTWTNRNRK